MSTDNSTSTMLSKLIFELRMTSHKTNAKRSFEIHKDSVCLFVCLRLFNDILPFKRKSAYTFTNKTTKLSIKTGNRHLPEY